MLVVLGDPSKQDQVPLLELGHNLSFAWAKFGWCLSTVPIPLSLISSISGACFYGLVDIA